MFNVLIMQKTSTFVYYLFNLNLNILTAKNYTKMQPYSKTGKEERQKESVNPFTTGTRFLIYFAYHLLILHIFKKSCGD